jgi:hypothetical protein
MKKLSDTIILQLWEESIKGKGSRPDGCSIHIDLEARLDYINREYELRQSNVIPDEYEVAVGAPIEVNVTDNIYNVIKVAKSIRLLQTELRNLVELKEIEYILN